MKVVKENGKWNLTEAKGHKKEYASMKKDIQKKLKELSKLLDIHEKEFLDDSGNFGFVGDLGRISNDLSDLLQPLKSNKK